MNNAIQKGLSVGAFIAAICAAGAYDISKGIYDRPNTHEPVPPEPGNNRPLPPVPPEPGNNRYEIPYSLRWLGQKIWEIGEISYELEMESFVEEQIGLKYKVAPKEYIERIGQTIEKITFRGKRIPHVTMDCMTNLLYSIGLSPDAVEDYVERGKIDLTDIVESEREFFFK